MRTTAKIRMDMLAALNALELEQHTPGINHPALIPLIKFAREMVKSSSDEDLAYPPSLYPSGPSSCCSGSECGCMGLPTDPPFLWETLEEISRHLDKSMPGWRRK